MTPITLPRKPVKNWEQQRDEWVAAVTQLVTEAESWCRERNWWVHRDQKTITEERIGSYSIPVLMIQAPAGRLIFNPIARYVVGALGRIDLCVFPSYDQVLVVRTDAGWRFRSSLDETMDRPWSQEAFFEIATQLMALA